MKSGKKSIRVGVAAAAVMGTVLVTPASAADKPAPPNKPIQTVGVQGAKGLKVDKEAPGKTKRILESNTRLATAASNACGSSYTISTGAWRLPSSTTRYGTLYTWTNGTTTGSSIYDKPICALFFNDTGYTKYMGVRLRSNYTADAPDEDFGAYSQYAGPVYQKRGYCGKAYAYMEASNGTVLVDAIRTVGSCN